MLANTTEIQQRIDTITRILDVTIPSAALDQLARWIEQVLTWNQRIDLTAARTLDELVDLCLADAIEISKTIAEGLSIVDIGTGAGAPGLPLAILRPDLNITLVEPLAKRVAFLRTVIGSLHITATVEKKKGEQLLDRTFDIAVSRATLNPTAWLSLGLRLVNKQGRVAVLLARKEAPQVEGIVMHEETTYTWPLTQASRRLLWYQRP